MRVRPLVAAILLASAIARGEPLSPRVAGRYRAMLEANPVEGIALDRLWSGAVDGGTTEELLASYRAADGVSAKLVFGHLLRKAGRDAEAVAAYEDAARLAPGNPLPLMALGRADSNRARPKEAAEWFEKAVAVLSRDDPRRFDALLQLGAAWSAAGEPAKAAAAWDAAATAAPGDLELRQRLAEACAAAGQPALALGHYEILATSADSAGRVAALREMARLHSASGRFSEAMQAVERAAAMTAPGSWLRTELLAQIIHLAQREHGDEALEKKWLAQALANPRDLGGQLQMVEFYERTGRLPEQRVWLEKVVSLTPGNAANELRLARLLSQMDLQDEAAARYDRLLAAQPGNSDLVFERARLDLRREDAAAARARIRRLLDAREDDAALRARALEFFQEHKLAEQIEEHLRADAARGGEAEIVALSEFLFSLRRNDEARTVLAGLIRASDDAATRARLHLRAAEHLKAHAELTAAVTEAEAAAKLAPRSREAQLLIGELRGALAQHAEARAACERAWELSADEAERLEADGRLFECVRSAAAARVAGEGRPGANAAAQVESFIRELMSRANETRSPAGWLRVARWKAWNGDKASAVTFATKAADMEPRNPAPREFLARHSASNGDLASAVVHFREVMELNPAGRDGYLREIAQLELQRGNAGEAIEILDGLAKAAPGSADALADLASAQERAGRMSDALATWRKVYSVAPPQRRPEVLASLLRAMEREGLHEEAGMLLLRSVDEAADDRARVARLDELLLHSQRHGRMAWVRDIFEKRRRARADDYLAATALGRILKMSGEKAAAFDMFAEAVFSMPDQAAALPELVREAEELRRPETAVRLQEQFLRLSGSDRPDGFLKLAALHEAAGDVEGAERAWSQAVARFPRDAGVVRRAAEFHREWGEPDVAASLLGKLFALEPADVQIAIELGAARMALGDLARAREAFESVMRLTKPVAATLFPADRNDAPWSGGRFFPDTRLLREGDGAGRVDSSERGDADSLLRLVAIRRLAEIATRAGTEEAAKWNAAWRDASAVQQTDALWGLWFGGARKDALDLVARAMNSDDGGLPHRQAFIWMALESGAYARLGAWLNDGVRTPQDLETFSLAFARFVKARPASVDAAMLGGLFPAGPAVLLWPSALELLRNGRMSEAVVLGRRAVERAGPSRAAYAVDVARWLLALDRPGEARLLLESVCGTPGDSFDAPVFTAMRELHYALPEAGRRAFAAAVVKDAGAGTMHGLLARVLFSVIEGSDEEGSRVLSEIFARRPLGVRAADAANSALREWAFAGEAAARLIEWGSPSLARLVFEIVSGDGALRRLQARQPVREEKDSQVGWREADGVAAAMSGARMKRDALVFLASGKIERESTLRELARQPEAGGLPEFAEVIESLPGGAALSVAAYRLWWEADLQNPAALRKLIESSRAASDVVTSEAVRRRCIDEGINPGNDTTPREFSLELAELLIERGAHAEALTVLEKAVERFPEEVRLLHRKARLLEDTCRVEEAAAAWAKLAEMEGGTAYARAALAGVLEERGDFHGAIAVRVRSGSSGDTQLPSLYFRAGQVDAALTAAERLSGPGAVQGAMALAEAMALRGDARGARAVLVAAVSKTTDVRALLQARAKLLTIPGLPPSAAFVSRMHLRMRDAVAASPELAEGYCEFFERHTTKLKITKT